MKDKFDITEIFPRKFTRKHSYIFDGTGKVCMNVLIDDDTIIKLLMDKLNGELNDLPKNKFYLSDEKDTVKYIDHKIFLMRGWGYLTSVLNYSAEDAKELQLQFLTWVINVLNNETTD